MIQNILGNYLIEKGVLSREQLVEIISEENDTRVKLGLMAVADGLLTVKEADFINRLQLVEDKRFGDIAVEKGYLTEEQVGGLLNLQNNGYLRFIQVLTEKNVIDISEVHNMIECFKKDLGLSTSHLEALKSGDSDNIAPYYLIGETAKIKDLVQLLLRLIVRRVDRNVYIDKAKLVSELPIGGSVMQEVAGENGFNSYFVDVDGGLPVLASEFAGEIFEDISEDSLDACAEFLNCVNGLYVSKLSYDSNLLELEPPFLCEESGMISGGEIYAIPVFVKGKEFLFVVQYI